MGVGVASGILMGSGVGLAIAGALIAAAITYTSSGSQLICARKTQVVPVALIRITRMGARLLMALRVDLPRVAELFDRR